MLRLHSTKHSLIFKIWKVKLTMGTRNLLKLSNVVLGRVYTRENPQVVSGSGLDWDIGYARLSTSCTTSSHATGWHSCSRWKSGNNAQSNSVFSVYHKPVTLKRYRSEISHRASSSGTKSLNCFCWRCWAKLKTIDTEFSLPPQRISKFGSSRLVRSKQSTTCSTCSTWTWRKSVWSANVGVPNTTLRRFRWLFDVERLEVNCPGFNRLTSLPLQLARRGFLYQQRNKDMGVASVWFWGLAKATKSH